jgi:hypothetical protein
MAARKPIPDDHSVMRFAQLSKHIIDPDTGKSVGVSPAAFALGPEDKGGLSVTWVEHFGPNSSGTRVKAALAYRESLKSKHLGAAGAFVSATVGNIKKAAVPFKKNVRVVHDPVPGNQGHAEIRRFNDDDLELLEHLSADVFGDIEYIGAMNLPKSVTN